MCIRLVLVHLYGLNLQIIHGIAGEHYVPDLSPQGFLAEVLGHLASSEGYPYILYQWGLVHPYFLKNLQVVIPAYFGSMWVPLNFSSSSGPTSEVEAISDRVVLCSNFPFRDFQVCSDAQVMELYDAFEILRLGCQAPGHDAERPIEQRESRWKITKDICVEALGCYLIYGGCKDGPYEHTNASLPGASTAWLNVIIPVSIPCKSGDDLICRIQCHVYEEPAPSYHFTHSVERDGVRVEELEGHISFAYADILGDLVDLGHLANTKGKMTK